MPNQFQQENPFSNPLLRALAIYQQLTGIQDAQRQRDYFEERRRREAESYEMERQDRARAQKLQDAEVEMKLNSYGARRGDPRVESALDDAFGKVASPRARVDLPQNSYYLPTEEERYRKQLERSTVEINLPALSPKLAGIFPGDTLRVDRAKAVDALKELREANRLITMGVKPDLKNLAGLSVDYIDLKPSELPSYINSLKPRQHNSTDEAGRGHVTTTDLYGNIVNEASTSGIVGKPQREDNPFPELPAVLREQAKQRAYEEVAKSGGFTNGKRESAEFKQAVAAKANEYKQQDIENNRPLKRDEQYLIQAQRYYRSGLGKGAVEVFEKIEDSDDYRKALQKHTQRVYDQYRKARGLAGGRKGGAATGSVKYATQSDIEEYAREKGISIEEARRQAEREGYRVK
jgi:hypothetical protein